MGPTISSWVIWQSWLGLFIISVISFFTAVRKITKINQKRIAQNETFNNIFRVSFILNFTALYSGKTTPVPLEGRLKLVSCPPPPSYCPTYTGATDANKAVVDFRLLPLSVLPLVSQCVSKQCRLCLANCEHCTHDGSEVHDATQRSPSRTEPRAPATYAEKSGKVQTCDSWDARVERQTDRLPC